MPYKKHSDRLAYSKNYYRKNRDKYKKANPARSRKANEKWRLKNPDYNAKYYQQNREMFRNRMYLNHYGITVSDYEALAAKQEGRCAICDAPRSSKRCLAVDHCHESKTVRGLLCARCNGNLGWFEQHQAEVLNYLMRNAQAVA